MRPLRPATRFVILGGMTLLAFGLRAYRLDAQSYWIDEGWTLHYAAMTPDQLWHTLQTTKIVPPLYHFATLYWSWLVGNGEYVMRFCSLVFGVLSVPLTYRLGRALGDARLGFVAALLMTVAPYQIWHAQDARNYTMLTAAAILSMWSFVQLTNHAAARETQRRRIWHWRLLYLLGTEWALLTHYHAVILIGIQGLFVLVTWRQRWRDYLEWGALLAAVLGMFGVWLYFGFGLLKSYLNWIPQPALWESYARSAVAYSVGELVPLPQAAWLTLAFVALFVPGVWYAARRSWGAWRGSQMLAFVLVYTLAPNLAAWLYGELRTPVYLERYLIPVQVGYLMGVALGVLAVADGVRSLLNRRKLAWSGRVATIVPRALRGAAAATLPIVLLLGISGWVLSKHYCDPAYAKPDWRTIAQTIEDHELPGDGIIMTGDGSDRVFKFYFKGQAPLYLDFNTPAPPPEQAIDLLAGIAARHRRLWYTPYGVEIDTTLEDWLARNAYPAWQSWVARQRLALYATDPPGGLPSRPVEVAFTDTDGHGLRVSSVAAPERAAAADVVPLSLTWAATAQIRRTYQVSLRLVDRGGDRFTQADWPPLAASGATVTWQPDQEMIDRRGLWLPADVPPGPYRIEAVVYDAETGQALGQSQTVAQLQVAPAQRIVPVRALGIPLSTQQSLGDVRLVGYAMPESLQPGQALPLWLYWQATPPGNQTVADGRLRLALAGPLAGGATGSALTPEITALLSESVGPLSGWQTGQVRRAVYHLPTSPRLGASQATVQVTLVTDSGAVTAGLPPIRLQQRPRQFEPPQVAEATDVAFGSPATVKLVGYDMPARQTSPDAEMEITLHWQSLAEIDANYTVFVQILSTDWHVVAQADRQPLAGAAPTNTWLAGEFLTDPYRLRLPADVPSGDYRVIAGLYDANTGQRLPVSSGGDFFDLGTVNVL